MPKHWHLVRTSGASFWVKNKSFAMRSFFGGGRKCKCFWGTFCSVKSARHWACPVHYWLSDDKHVQKHDEQRVGAPLTLYDWSQQLVLSAAHGLKVKRAIARCLVLSLVEEEKFAKITAAGGTSPASVSSFVFVICRGLPVVHRASMTSMAMVPGTSLLLVCFAS